MTDIVEDEDLYLPSSQVPPPLPPVLGLESEGLHWTLLDWQALPLPRCLHIVHPLFPRPEPRGRLVLARCSEAQWVQWEAQAEPTLVEAHTLVPPTTPPMVDGVWVLLLGVVYPLPPPAPVPAPTLPPVARYLHELHSLEPALPPLPGPAPALAPWRAVIPVSACAAVAVCSLGRPACVLSLDEYMLTAPPPLPLPVRAAVLAQAATALVAASACGQAPGTALGAALVVLPGPGAVPVLRLCAAPALPAVAPTSLWGWSLRRAQSEWCAGRLTTLDYLLRVNAEAGRVCGGARHPVVPWVLHATPSGRWQWRDLTRSQARLRQGDAQLEAHYEATGHHVTDPLSHLTLRVYASRCTVRAVLEREVRTVWVVHEYPATLARLAHWSPDEAIPEFYLSGPHVLGPSLFTSRHADMPDLGLPDWAADETEFVARHREALEGARVAAALPVWLDLTFGCALSGTAALEARNVPLAGGGYVQLWARPHPPHHACHRPTAPAQNLAPAPSLPAFAKWLARAKRWVRLSAELPPRTLSASSSAPPRFFAFVRPSHTLHDLELLLGPHAAPSPAQALVQAAWSLPCPPAPAPSLSPLLARVLPPAPSAHVLLTGLLPLVAARSVEDEALLPLLPALLEALGSDARALVGVLVGALATLPGNAEALCSPGLVRALLAACPEAHSPLLAALLAALSASRRRLACAASQALTDLAALVSPFLLARELCSPLLRALARGRVGHVEVAVHTLGDLALVWGSALTLRLALPELWRLLLTASPAGATGLLRALLALLPALTLAQCLAQCVLEQSALLRLLDSLPPLADPAVAELARVMVAVLVRLAATLGPMRTRRHLTAPVQRFLDAVDALRRTAPTPAPPLLAPSLSAELHRQLRPVLAPLGTESAVDAGLDEALALGAGVTALSPAWLAHLSPPAAPHCLLHGTPGSADESPLPLCAAFLGRVVPGEAQVTAVAASPSEQAVAVAVRGPVRAQVRVWPVAELCGVGAVLHEAGERPVRALAWAAEDVLVSADAHVLSVSDARTGTALLRTAPPRPHGDYVDVLVWRAGGRTGGAVIASLLSGGAVAITDARAAPAPVLLWRCGAEPTSISAEASLLVVGHATGTVTVLDSRTGRLLHALRAGAPVVQVRALTAGRVLAATAPGSAAEAGVLLWSQRTLARTFTGHRGRVLCATKGDDLVSVSEAGVHAARGALVVGAESEAAKLSPVRLPGPGLRMRLGEWSALALLPMHDALLLGDDVGHILALA